jgi:cyclase
MRQTWMFAVALVLLALVVAAQDQDLSKVEMKVVKVSGNVYMLQGAGGNIGASVGEDGIVIVDDEFAPLADKIRAALRGITDKPVRFVINTTGILTIPAATNPSARLRP